MTETPIERARAAERLLRSRFEHQKAQEWAVVSATAKSETAKAVYDAHDAGISVTQIAKEYGTKNRGTIYDILKQRTAYNALLVSEPITITPLDNGNVCISVHNYADWTQTAPEPYSGSINLNLTTQVPVVGSASTEGGPLHRELASAPLTSPLWTYILEHTEDNA